MRLSKIQIICGVVVLFLIIFAVHTTKAARQHDGLLRVYFLDVGQGDAILVEAPNGNQVLVDGGPPGGAILSALSAVMPFYDRTIDAVVASHPHADHIGGLIDVLDRYDVGMVIQAQELYDSSDFRAWQKAVDDEGATNVEALARRQVVLGPETILTILHPFNSVAGTRTKTPHDDVVVAILEHKHVRVLLTGDMESDVEGTLIKSGTQVKADVLKIGHHGSNTSTSAVFLSAVHPATAVIEVGAKNRYHHPAPAILTRLETNDIPYYRTDIHGTVTLTSNGESFTIQPTRK